MASTPPKVMQCMEVWGGNVPVDGNVVMSGLDAWVYCKPYTAEIATPSVAGGDVYYVSSCATGRITRLLVADVSGHGLAVCNVASSLRTLMRKYVNYVDPLRFVSEMNRQFADYSRNGCFATAVVATFFSPTIAQHSATQGIRPLCCTVPDKDGHSCNPIDWMMIRLLTFPSESKIHPTTGNPRCNFN